MVILHISVIAFGLLIITGIPGTIPMIRNVGGITKEKLIANTTPAMIVISIVFTILCTLWALSIHHIAPSIVSITCAGITILLSIHSAIRAFSLSLFSDKIERGLILTQLISQTLLITCYLVWAIQQFLK